MATSIDDITNLIHGFTLSKNASEDHGQESPSSASGHSASLQDDIQGLGQSTDTIALQAQSVGSLANDTDTFKTTSNAPTESQEQSVIGKIRLLASEGAGFRVGRPPAKKLLLHFDADIKQIVRHVIKNTNDENILWRAAEACYKQAASPSGRLHADNYFDSLEEAQMEWPCDPDFESEDYYEHEDRVEVDEDYAAAFVLKAELRSEACRKDRQAGSQAWVDFWIRALNRSPNGPTLFYPPAGFQGKFFSLDVPRYLFRTFDWASSGTNNDEVMASMASITGQNSSQSDVLGLETQKAAKLLHMHLQNYYFNRKQHDNLMSWTSSLLFAIQYAVWRAHKYGRPTSHVKICAVDTREFPLGQFARDVPLLEACHATAEELGGQMLRFFDFRLNNNDFYNGEYLSQGRLNHARRSCVVSLEQLIHGGLYQLYPEFEDKAGRKRWTKRVRHLRQDWLPKRTTSDHDIRLAIQMGHDCFHHFELCDIALVILTLKNRELSRPGHAGNTHAPDQVLPKWADKPAEVSRYWIAAEAIRASNERPCKGFHLSPDRHEMLRSVFACNSDRSS